MNRDIKLMLTQGELGHLIDTLSDCQMEFEELMREKEWFVTEVVDRVQTALEILSLAKVDDE